MLSSLEERYACPIAANLSENLACASSRLGLCCVLNTRLSKKSADNATRVKDPFTEDGHLTRTVRYLDLATNSTTWLLLLFFKA